MVMEEDDDMPVLSGDTLAALKEFYTEKDVQAKRFAELQAEAEEKAKFSINDFSEDWNASQFWYSDETASKLAKELLDGATNETAIVVVSAPSVFIQLKNLLASEASHISPRLNLLEIDTRFSVFKEFARYDFNTPFNLPMEMKGSYDRIICDPPFLSEDCQTKAAMTVRWLQRKPTMEGSGSKVIVCTGERMEALIHKLYTGIRTTTFEPKHTKGLSNEFQCYANYESTSWTWR